MRPAIEPALVKIYFDPPLQYETIGLVEAYSEVLFSDQAAQDRAILELKKQAARIGANGILLINMGNQSGGMVGFYSNNVFYAASSTYKAVQARAIYVIEE